MNQQFKAYLAEIGRRGGSATTAKKTAAVRKNGALGGRPRKDGRPPGSKPLEDVLDEIEASTLSSPAKRDMKLWLRSNTKHFHAGMALVHRGDLLQVKEMLSRRTRGK